MSYRLHDLPHSTATYLLAAGVDPRIVMQIMGWSQISMLKRYQQVLPAMLADAADRLHAVFPTARVGLPAGVDLPPAPAGRRAAVREKAACRAAGQRPQWLVAVDELGRRLLCFGRVTRPPCRLWPRPCAAGCCQGCCQNGPGRDLRGVSCPLE